MSDKPKYPRDKALEVANSLVRLLGPWCERIEVAGSLRRGKKEVGDVELLMIPKYLTRTVDLFGDESCNLDLADKTINSYLQSCLIKKRPSKIGVFTWGPKNKLAIHSETGIPVDFFTVHTDVCPCVVLAKKYNGDYDKAISSESGAIQSHLRFLREEVSREERQSMQQKLQCPSSMERREGETTGTQSPGHELLHLQEAGSKQALLASETNMLRAVQESIASSDYDGAEANKDGQGCVQSDAPQAGICNGVVSRKIRCGNQETVCDGASPNNGEAPGEKIAAVGNSPSPQRCETRQPNREFGNRNVENTHGERPLSSLPERVQDKIICPLCHGVGMFAPNWFVSLVIRTGSKETNLKLTNGAIAKGGTLHAYGGFTDRYGRTVYPKSEMEVFELCGVQYLEPEQR